MKHFLNLVIEMNPTCPFTDCDVAYQFGELLKDIEADIAVRNGMPIRANVKPYDRRGDLRYSLLKKDIVYGDGAAIKFKVKKSKPVKTENTKDKESTKSVKAADKVLRKKASRKKYSKKKKSTIML
jgi:hypothetical protein